MASRKEILELLANGKLTADEAAEMLTSASSPKATEEMVVVPEIHTKESSEGLTPKWFRVRVRNLETGKNKVNVNIPMGMLKFGLKIGRRFAPEMEELNWDDINGMVSDMNTGMIVEVQDEDSNEHVQVFLE